MALLRGRRRRQPDKDKDGDDALSSSLYRVDQLSSENSLSHDNSESSSDNHSHNGDDSPSDHWQPDPPSLSASRKSRRPLTSRATSSRLTRGAAAAAASTAPASSVTVSRSPSSLKTGSPGGIHLTVKMSSSKLRQVTNSRSSRGNRHNIFTEDPVIQGKRRNRNTRNLKEISEDDDDDEEEEIEDEEEDEVDDSEDGAGEDDEVDADGDLEMEDDTPQPPVSKRSTRPAAAAAKVKNQAVKSVEEKEMELSRDEDDDEELSELDSDAEGEVDDTMLQDEELGEGIEEEGDEEEDGLGSDDDSSSPDVAKLTKRQRGSLGNDFLQLPMEPQIKKHLTAEEHAMRRAEMARRRKNLSEKRNEEEKMDTINRLLKKQAPKRRGRIPAAETAGEATPEVPAEPEKADPTMIRWVSGREGCKALVPDELLRTPAARPFGGLPGGKLIEEV